MVMGQLTDFYGTPVQPGDIILHAMHSRLEKAVFIKQTKAGTPVISDKVEENTYTWGKRAVRSYGKGSVDEHNSFIYKPQLGDFLIVDQKRDFNAKDYKKSIQEYEKEFKQKQDGQSIP